MVAEITFTQGAWLITYKDEVSGAILERVAVDNIIIDISKAACLKLLKGGN